MVNFSGKSVRLYDSPGLAEPPGWTVIPLTTLPAKVGARDSVTETWQVTAPAATGTTTFTDTIAAVQASVSHSLSQQLRLTVASTG